MSKKILVADVPHTDDRYRAAFGGWELAFVRTLAEARKALAERGPDILVIGVYFDDSQMFDLLRSVRHDARHAKVPILCVRGRPGFTAVTSRTLEMSCKALGAQEFIDLGDFPDDASGNAALRQAAERVMAS